MNVIKSNILHFSDLMIINNDKNKTIFYKFKL